MKYLIFILIFSIGFFLGRLSNNENALLINGSYTQPRIQDAKEGKEKVSKTKGSLQNESITSVQKKKKKLDGNSDESQKSDSKFHRDALKQKNKIMRRLYGKLKSSIQSGDLNEQNRIFNKMVSLDPKHEYVYQAKVNFLEDDGEWEEAHSLLKECAYSHPKFIYCHSRLSNIRSSTLDDKIKHGLECLKLKKNEPLCLVDLAVAYKFDRQFDLAKKYFELALSRENESKGYFKNFILYHYGLTLKELELFQKAVDSLNEACTLKMKAACSELDKMG